MNYVYRVTRGEIYMAMGEIQKAISDFTYALSLDGNIQEAYDNRAKCYRKLADAEQDAEKKADLISKAEADEHKAEALKKEEKNEIQV